MKLTDKDKSLKYIDHISNLNEEVKTLAINMAVYLAKIKSKSEEVSHLEPEFIKLINGTVKVVQEVTKIINAAQNKEKIIFEIPSGEITTDQIENKLNSILEQCQVIMENLIKKTDLKI